MLLWKLSFDVIRTNKKQIELRWKVISILRHLSNRILSASVDTHNITAQSTESLHDSD